MLHRRLSFKAGLWRRGFEGADVHSHHPIRAEESEFMRRPGAQLPEEFGKRGFGNTEGIQGDQLIAREDAGA